MNKIPEKILIVSKSGDGKTTSARNLDKNTTGFINAEYKTLPFDKDFKHHSLPTTWEEVYNAMIEFGKNDEIKVVFLDSLSAYLEMLMAYARKTKSGYNIFSYYNEQVSKFLTLIKRYPKTLFITAHYEWVNEEGGVPEKRVKTKGNEWKSVIEKEFSMVIYGGVEIDAINKQREYRFYLHTDGTNSAKTPPRIFGPEVEYIDNDCQIILNALNKKK